MNAGTVVAMIVCAVAATICTAICRIGLQLTRSGVRECYPAALLGGLGLATGAAIGVLSLLRLMIALVA